MQKRIMMLMVFLIAILLPSTAFASPAFFEGFEKVSEWEKIAAPGNILNLSAVDGYQGNAICMDYDFGKNKSYVLIGKKVDFTCLPNHEFTFYINRSKPSNSFEFKLIDANGNTYMKKWYSYASVNKWKKVTIKTNDIKYAWGPDSTKELNKVVRLEIVITGGGKGRVCVDSLSFAKTEYVRPKGYYPRWLYDEQAYWTIVGVPEDAKEMVICEDGTIEPHRRGFSLMPFLYTEGKLITRDNAKITHCLADDSLPIPSVIWEYKDIVFETTLLADGEAGASTGYTKYSIRNQGQEKISGKLFLAIEPYQVYPPWHGGGGISVIHKIENTGKAIAINDTYQIIPVTLPDQFGAQKESESSPEGNIIDFLNKGTVPKKQVVTDSSGFASAAIQYDFELEAGEEREMFVVHPLYDVSAKGDTLAWDKRYASVLKLWREKVNKVDISIPEKRITDVFKSNIAYNLITRDGNAFQPGSRSYDKAWMRDGGIQGIALLEAGLTVEPKAFIDWFETFQFDSGEIPPIIDMKAKDPLWEEKINKLVEYDSQGEYIWYIWQYYLFTKDVDFLNGKYASVIKALRFLQALRAKRTTVEYKNASDEKRLYYGILPESTSHEGYYMKHSYWDDFWGLCAFKDGLKIAKRLKRNDDIIWIKKEYDAFKKSVYDSLNRLIDLKQINYIPGCVELADFDPTSTSGAITYCGQLSSLPQKQLQAGYDMYFKQVENRQKVGATYRITPYEIRSVSAFLMMGQKQRALELLRFLLDGIRPTAWNTFAEVLHSEYRFPTYLGDIPHTWVGAEYIMAIRNIFLIETEEALQLGCGIDEKWLKEGVSVKNMPSHFGDISYQMKEQDGMLIIKVSGQANPKQGFMVYLPYTDKQVVSVLLNGVNVKSFNNERVHFESLPAELCIKWN